MNSASKIATQQSEVGIIISRIKGYTYVRSRIGVEAGSITKERGDGVAAGDHPLLDLGVDLFRSIDAAEVSHA